jgi:hypothetical protein
VANWLTYVKMVGYIDFREFSELPDAIVNSVFLHNLVASLRDVKDQLADATDSKAKAKLMTMRAKIETRINEHGKE